MVLTCGTFVDNGTTEIFERSCGTICSGYTDGFSMTCFSTEIIEVFIFAVNKFLLSRRSPCVAASPCGLCRQIQYDSFIFPISKVGRREAPEILSAPPRYAITRGIDIITVSKMRVYDLWIGMESWKYRISTPFLLCANSDTWNKQDDDK